MCLNYSWEKLTALAFDLLSIRNIIPRWHISGSRYRLYLICCYCAFIYSFLYSVKNICVKYQLCDKVTMIGVTTKACDEVIALTLVKFSHSSLPRLYSQMWVICKNHNMWVLYFGDCGIHGGYSLGKYVSGFWTYHVSFVVSALYWEHQGIQDKEIELGKWSRPK